VAHVREDLLGLDRPRGSLTGGDREVLDREPLVVGGCAPQRLEVLGRAALLGDLDPFERLAQGLGTERGPQLSSAAARAGASGTPGVASSSVPRR
jgi:hypothetical protein